MQDEVNEKTMALCIKGGKISAQILKAALTKLLAEIEKKKQQSKKMGGQNRCRQHHGSAFGWTIPTKHRSRQ